MSPTAPPGGRISLHFSSYAYKSLNTRERQLGTTSEPLFFFLSFFPRLIVSLASDRTALDFTSQEAPRSCGEQAAVTAHPPVSTPCLCVHYCTCVCVCARASEIPICHQPPGEICVETEAVTQFILPAGLKGSSTNFAP